MTSDTLLWCFSLDPIISQVQPNQSESEEDTADPVVFAVLDVNGYPTKLKNQAGAPDVLLVPPPYEESSSDPPTYTECADDIPDEIKDQLYW